METATNRKQGLYVSYNEQKNGPFDEAVRISNELGCLTWLDKSLITRHLVFPTQIFVKLTRKERYFQGTLLAIATPDKVGAEFALREVNHRPLAWRQSPWSKDFRSVLFISRLHEVEKPTRLESLGAPERPTYVDL